FLNLNPYSWYDIDHSDDTFSQEDLEESSRAISENLTIDKDANYEYAGVWDGQDFDLTLSYIFDGKVSIEANGTYEE
ncbi:hypothetical protein ACYT6H_10675, partial [Streptococcus pyogenes]